MNQTIKETIVRRSHYDDHEQLQRYLSDFAEAYKFAYKLKMLSC